MQYILIIAEAEIKNGIHTKMRYPVFPDKIPLDNGDINVIFYLKKCCSYICIELMSMLLTL